MTIKIYNDIGSKEQQILFDSKGIRKKVFSVDALKDILLENPNEKTLHFDINCQGGLITEGFAIYDLLRTSGKEIFCNIDGACHSMAIVILLAAPKENRTANPNSKSVIHDVRGYAGNVSAKEAQEFADYLIKERERILDVYTERTGHNRTELEAIMLEQKMRTANELLEWGFISKINPYTTNQVTNNQNIKNMSKAKELLKDIANFFKGEVVNYDFTDSDGKILFSTEKEDDSIAVGDPATPDGTFTLPDGRTVTIANGVITEITEPEPVDVQALQNRITELTAQLEAEKAKNTQASNLLIAAQGELSELEKIRSNAVIPPRVGAPGKAGAQNKTLTPEERKAEAKAKLDKLKGGTN